MPSLDRGSGEEEGAIDVDIEGSTGQKSLQRDELSFQSVRARDMDDDIDIADLPGENHGPAAEAAAVVNAAKDLVAQARNAQQNAMVAYKKICSISESTAASANASRSLQAAIALFEEANANLATAEAYANSVAAGNANAILAKTKAMVATHNAYGSLYASSAVEGIIAGVTVITSSDTSPTATSAAALADAHVPSKRVGPI